jgi:predicted nucleotidyltransferase
LTRPIYPVSRELRRLENEGLFRSEINGRQKYFQLNRQYPLFDQVRGIVTKTVGAIPLIVQTLKKIKGIDEAYLYGSCARNRQGATSDIDVLVIGAPRADADFSFAEAVRESIELIESGQPALFVLTTFHLY